MRQSRNSPNLNSECAGPILSIPPLQAGLCWARGYRAAVARARLLLLGKHTSSTAVIAVAALRPRRRHPGSDTRYRLEGREIKARRPGGRTRSWVDLRSTLEPACGLSVKPSYQKRGFTHLRP
eukprot:COSAG01_NODE_7201_length_3306_cov_59.287496_2_plen_123_part_00